MIPKSWGRVMLLKPLAHMEKETNSITTILINVVDGSHKLNLVTNQITNIIYTTCESNYKPKNSSLLLSLFMNFVLLRT